MSDRVIITILHRATNWEIIHFALTQINLMKNKYYRSDSKTWLCQLINSDFEKSLNLSNLSFLIYRI